MELSPTSLQVRMQAECTLDLKPALNVTVLAIHVYLGPNQTALLASQGFTFRSLTWLSIQGPAHHK